MIDTILFDFDGTLFDTAEGITKCTQYALKKQGIDAALEALRCFAGPPLIDMFMEKYGMDEEHAKQALLDFQERYISAGINEYKPFDGIGELIGALKANGKKLCVATSKPEFMAVKLLKDVGLFDLFDSVRGSVIGKNNVAKWQVVIQTMEDIGCTESSCVLVGDTKWDVLGAHRAGIRCVGVRYGYAADGELEQAGADYIADDLNALEALLLKL